MSSSLFVVNSVPMVFYITPLMKSRVKITDDITRHGGKVTKQADSGQVYHVIEESKAGSFPSTGSTKLAVTDTFITDSINLGQLQPVEMYAPKARYAALQSLGVSRSNYTNEEDYVLFSFAARNKRTGNPLWKAAEQQKLTAHSWESMKNHFNKKLAHGKVGAGGLAAALRRWRWCWRRRRRWQLRERQQQRADHATALLLRCAVTGLTGFGMLFSHSRSLTCVHPSHPLSSGRTVDA
jgi:hypothetical protein